MEFPCFASDTGYGVTKSAYMLNGDTIYRGFPSLAPQAINHQLTGADFPTQTPEKKTIKIRVNGNTFEVGEGTTQLAKAFNGGRYLSEDYPTTDAYTALTLGSLFYANATRVRVLALGLPVNTAQIYSDYIKQKFVGTFDVAGRRIQIDKVMCIPQPLGALASWTKHVAPAERARTRLLLDFGYQTTDWVVTEGYDIIYARSGGREGGVSHVLNAIAESIVSDYWLGPLDRFERIDQALLKSTPLQYYSMLIGVDELRRRHENAKLTMEETLQAISKRVGDKDDFAEILVAGGGGAQFIEMVKARFPDNLVNQIPNSQFAIADGLLTMAQQYYNSHYRFGGQSYERV